MATPGPRPGERLSAWCDMTARAPRDDEPRGFAYYDCGPPRYAVNGIEVTFTEFAKEALDVGHRKIAQLTSALTDLVDATARLKAGDAPSDVLFGVLDMRTRACTILGIDPGSTE